MDTDTTEPRAFIPYPMNRVVGTVADTASAQATLDALLGAGFAREDIEVLHGDAGERRLDPTGDAHGLLAQLQRTLLRVAAPAEEHTHLLRHVDDLRAGRAVFMVLAQERGRRELAADILNAHGATFIGFYGKWAWQGFTPATEAAPAEANRAPGDRAPGDETSGDRAAPVTPDSVPSRFAAAWNGQDPGGLASLFDEDATFVNGAGRWWHDRASIRAACADTGERLFAAPRLTVGDVRVRRLSPDTAVVHARVGLSDHASDGAAPRPTARASILSFVVHRTAAGWSCAAAQTTDVASMAAVAGGAHVRNQ